MFQIKDITKQSNHLSAFYRNFTKNAIFFDIETTGLNWRTSHIYLIGVSYLLEDTWHIKQWFLQRPSEEKELLLEFSTFLKSFQRIIHFNGNSFDIPYLQHKYAFYQLSQPFEDLESADLYRMLKPWKNLLGLPGMKQKDLEDFQKLQRKDTFSGGGLIPVYQRYLSTADEELLSLLLLHNYEDVTGMIDLLPLLSYTRLTTEAYTEKNCRLLKDCLSFSLQLSDAVPQEIQQEDAICSLHVAGDQMELQIYGKQATMKHYYTDYKNYYYLPAEDTALHKSIAAYVDTGFKERAKASNCYQKMDGLFLPQPRICFHPAFYPELPKGMPYFLYQEASLSDIISSDQYLHSMIQYICGIK